MTEDQDTTSAAAGKLLTADQITEIQPQLIGWIKRSGALDPENIAGNVDLVLVQKYVGKPLTNDTLLPLAIKIAANVLSDERREGADKIRRDRRVTLDEKAFAAAADTTAAENDAADQVIENKQRGQERDAKLKKTRSASQSRSTKRVRAVKRACLSSRAGACGGGTVITRTNSNNFAVQHLASARKSTRKGGARRGILNERSTCSY